jgi:2-methylcitrate dehydratase PrpD
MKVTETLACFAAGFDLSSAPGEVRHQAVRSLVNWAGCALGGAAHPAVARAWQAFQPFMGIGRASVLGRPGRVDAPHAALLNGISSHVLDFDDTHLGTLVHPSGPVLSALLALAQHQPMEGRRFVDAMIVGIEVECRVAQGVCPEHYDMGWHVTGTAGGFGAAAAVGRALGLDEQRMAWALGIAATQAAGLREMFGTMCKSLHPGRAAQGGLGAALLAQAGFTSSTQAIEAPRGFAHVLSRQPHLADTVERLGERWALSTNSFKPYACGVVIHPIIDACLALRQQPGFDAREIASVSMQVHPLVLELTGKTAPCTGLEAKFSVFHAAAIALVQGVSNVGQYTDEATQLPAVVALRQRIEAHVRPDIREDEVHLAVTFTDGRTVEYHVDHALGSIERPMTDDDLSAKFLALADGVLPAHQVRTALDGCWRVEGLPDVAALAEHMTPA